jgi:hypothetical protein
MTQPSNGELYELVRELITGRMALLSSQLWYERSKPTPDGALCAEIREKSTRLFVERESLSARDRASLEAAIRRHAKSAVSAEYAVAAIAEFHGELNGTSGSGAAT